MSHIPMKYISEMRDAIRYVDEYEKYHTKISEGYTELSNEKYYDIEHYDTHIARLYPSSNVVTVFLGAYSASDRDIINSFLVEFGMSDRVAMSKKYGVYVKD